ncbi:hypothetical protein K438DRAFT_303117 [Mycena galopus ATCC 62051]|nr:hypothetical protein K438DRAFT_303117 [Mycena galopus ATCC 62051]
MNHGFEPVTYRLIRSRRPGRIRLLASRTFIVRKCMLFSMRRSRRPVLSSTSTSTGKGYILLILSKIGDITIRFDHAWRGQRIPNRQPLWRRRRSGWSGRRNRWRCRKRGGCHYEVQIDKLKEDLGRWLGSPPDTKDRQHELKSLHHQATGGWLLRDGRFVSWKATPGALWIKGISGTGKSVLR